MAVIPNSTKPIIPSVEKLKVKVLLAKIIPSKTLFPKIIAGMSAKTNIIKKIFVDIFILLFFAKKKIVYMSIKSNFFAQKITKENFMDKKEMLCEYLNAIYQNIRTALQSIDDILPKIKDESLKKELAEEEDKYYALEKECELFAKAENIEGIKDNNWFEKARLWSSINFSTMSDKTTRHIAELMLFGTFMGYITCIKDGYDHKDLSSELDEILNNLKELEKNNIENLIPFLAE